MRSVLVNDRTALVRELGARLCSLGETERAWFEGWQAEFDAVTATGDEDTCALLVDMLVAFDGWQREDEATDDRLRPEELTTITGPPHGVMIEDCDG